METVKAAVIEANGKHLIRIEARGEEIEIPISSDKPIEVKRAFNRLIAWVRNGAFEIELEDVGPDLFSQVASEYITQLNREIQEVYSEMKALGLIDS